MANLEKWDEFRARREVAIDKYIHARFLQSKVETILKYCILHKRLRTFANHYNRYKNKYINGLKLNFLIFRLKYRLKLRVQRRFGSFEQKV